MCLIPLAFIHNSNSCDVNWGPLSLTICSGNPYEANRLHNTSSVFSVVVVVVGYTFDHFKCASMTTMYIDP